MSVLIATPFSYQFDDLVKVKITSTNFFGTPTYSASNSAGARIRRIPDKMNTPFLVSRTTATMTIRWAALTAPATGNSPITAYNLYWDNGSGDVSIELADTLITEYSLTGLTGGVFYKF